MRRLSLRSGLPVLLLGVISFAGQAIPARAELVILADGSFLKVKDYQLDGEHALLTLRSGGRMTLPIERVDRVVDDEVAEPDPPPMAMPAVAAVAELPLRFDARQAVPDGPYGGMIWEAARRNSLNPLLVAAVIRAESAGNPRAMSRVGARGLMQLMPATAERFGVRYYNLFEPAQNLEAGSRYLSWLVDQFPNELAKVLAAYNAGENAVARYGGIPPYRETRNYVRRIYASLGLQTAATPRTLAPPAASPAAASATAAAPVTASPGMPAARASSPAAAPAISAGLNNGRSCLPASESLMRR